MLPLEEGRNDFFFGLHGDFYKGFFDIRVLCGRLEYLVYTGIKGFLAGQRRHQIHYTRELIEEGFRHNLLVFTFDFGYWEIGHIIPIFDLHLPIELGQGIAVDLVDQQFKGGAVFIRVVEENARADKGKLC